VPTYQYACTECGHGFEQFQAFSDDALTECPTCGGRLRKVFNSVGIVFKGSGFYRNDSREKTGVGAKDGKDGKDSKSSGDSSGSDKSGSSSTEKSSGDAKSTDQKSDKKADKSSGDKKKPDTSSSTAGSAA
jgi:putative FmdB family regulatory protein